MRVFISKIEVLAVRVQQKFDGAGVLVTHSPCCFDGGLAHLCPQGRGQGSGRGFFDEFLVAALDGAVPVAQMDHMAEPIDQHLKLDMAGAQHQLFQVHLVIAEAGLGLCFCRFKGGGKLPCVITAPDAPAAAARTGFEQHGIAHGFGGCKGCFHGVYRAVRAGCDRDPGRQHTGAGSRLAACPPDGVTGGPDEGDALSCAGIGKVCIFG